ncbi:hypothetical protein, partial [Mesorhizobium sp. M2D.F.Ca.ET.153.01.1.1]
CRIANGSLFWMAKADSPWQSNCLIEIKRARECAAARQQLHGLIDAGLHNGPEAGCMGSLIRL